MSPPTDFPPASLHKIILLIISVHGFHWRNLQSAHMGQVIVNIDVTEKMQYLWRAGEKDF